MPHLGVFLDRPSLRAKQYETFLEACPTFRKTCVTFRIQVNTTRLFPVLQVTYLSPLAHKVQYLSALLPNVPYPTELAQKVLYLSVLVQKGPIHFGMGKTLVLLRPSVAISSIPTKGHVLSGINAKSHVLSGTPDVHEKIMDVKSVDPSQAPPGCAGSEISHTFRH